MSLTTIIAATAALAQPEPEGRTAFARLSKDAQELIVWAMMAGEDSKPPIPITPEVKAEIEGWVNSEEA